MSLSDQRWPLASDPLHLSDPGTNLTPHSGCVQPTDSRTRCRLPPGGRTCVLLIDSWKGAVTWPYEGRWTWWRCAGVKTGDPSFSLHYTRMGRKKDGEPEKMWPMEKSAYEGGDGTISFIFRDLFVWQDLKGNIWKKTYDCLTLLSLRPCCSIFSSWSDFE